MQSFASLRRTMFLTLNIGSKEGVEMDSVIIQLAENNEIQEAAHVLSFAMIDNPIHLAVYQGQGEKERVETEKAFLDILNEIPAKIFLAKSGEKIIQKWRTSEFDPSDENSRLEIVFKAIKGGTVVTIRHSNLPEHGMQYKSGWAENYFDPMKEYFQRTAPNAG